MALLTPEHLKVMTYKPKFETYMKEGDDQSTAIARLYMHYLPFLSWREIAKELYNHYDTSLPALEKLRQFLPPIGSYSANNYAGVMCYNM